MLCPHGADFFVRRELATLGFGQRGVYVSFFFGREFMGRLLYARELQENPRKSSCVSSGKVATVSMACSSNRVIFEI
jgi:hypothetical protein